MHSPMHTMEAGRALAGSGEGRCEAFCGVSMRSADTVPRRGSANRFHLGGGVAWSGPGARRRARLTP